MGDRARSVSRHRQGMTAMLHGNRPTDTDFSTFFDAGKRRRPMPRPRDERWRVLATPMMQTRQDLHDLRIDLRRNSAVSLTLKIAPGLGTSS